MKKIATVVNDTITNIAAWDGVSEWNPQDVELVDVSHSISRIGEGVIDPITPPSVTDGLIWLDASDSSTLTLTGTRVDEWRDKMESGLKFVPLASGNSWNPSFDSSLYGERGGISFNNKFLESSSSLNSVNWSRFTIMMVMTNKQRSGMFFMANSNQAVTLGAFSGERVGLGSQGGIAQGIPRNEPVVIGSQCNGSSWKFILNESLLTPISGSSISIFSGDFPKVQIGGAAQSVGYGIFECAGILIYNRLLTSEQVKESSRWIKEYYGINEPSLPDWNVVLDGNSLSWGLSGLNTSALYDGVLEANGSPSAKDIEIRGWTAQNTPALTSRGIPWIDTRINPSMSPNKRIVVFWEGTNDLHANQATDIQCFNNIKQYCIDRKRAGWKVIVATILPMKISANVNFETYRLSVNQMLRDAKFNNETWIDAVADIANDSTIGNYATTSNLTYYTDGTHLTDLGHSIAKQYVTNAVNLVTGII